MKRLPYTTDRESVDRPVVEAVVALGANLGDRAATLAAAVDELARLPLTDAVRVSATIETAAWTPEGDDIDAPRYLNAVAIVSTRLMPDILLSYLHAIEERHGRVRPSVRDVGAAGSDDRTLDLDLIVYGDLVRHGSRLTLPHPRAAERPFVLAPWLELDPDAELVGHGRVDAVLGALGALGAPEEPS